MSSGQQMQDIQESAYTDGYDYRADSPHLKHAKLSDRLTNRLRGDLRHVVANGLPFTVLEVGAGDGAFVEPLLATGATVTATEMSRPSIDALQARFGLNSAFDAVSDPDGSMEALEGRRFAVILSGERVGLENTFAVWTRGYRENGQRV